MKVKVAVEVDIPDWLDDKMCVKLEASIYWRAKNCPFYAESPVPYCNLFDKKIYDLLRCQPCLDAIKEANENAITDMQLALG